MGLLKKIDLQFFVNNEWVDIDIDKSESFAFTLQASDITNPTITKIPFSVQISLPKTHNNNNIFSLICSRYDSNIVNINPLLRTDFRLYVNYDLYQEGYMKIENVDWLSNKINIRLYGSLGEYFYLMSEVSDDRNMQLKNLDFGNTFSHTINRNYVNSSWTNNGGFNNQYGTNRWTYFDYSTGTNVTEEIFNYAMTYSGLYENFDSSYLTNGVNEDERSEVIWQSGSKRYTAGRDLTEHERSFVIGLTQYYGEYRSYMQKPAVKVKPIICKIIEKMESEGWDTELDETFFNKYNPYWNDLWVILPNYETANDNIGDEIKFSGSTSPIFDHKTPITTRHTISLGRRDFEAISHVATFNVPFYLLTYQTLGDNDAISKTFNLDISVDVLIGGSVVGNLKYKHTNTNSLVLSDETTCAKNVVRFKDQTGMGSRSNPFYIYRRDTPQSPDNTNLNVSGIAQPYNLLQPDPGTATLYEFNGSISFNNAIAGEKEIQLRFDVSGITDWAKANGDVRGRSLQIILQDGSYSISSSDGSGTRTDKNITYSDIIRSEDTCYDFFMSYMKPFNMHFVKDKVLKKVYVMTRNTYYGKLERIDWTKKINYNKQHTINPVPFDYKIGVLKWLDGGTKYEEDYISKTSREYGSARYNTNYQFNDTENNYLDGNIINNAIPVTGYSNYFLGRNNTLYKDNKTLLYFQDKSNAGVDINYAFAFLDGRNTVNSPFTITDDNDGMLQYGYSWTNSPSVRIATRQYPNFVRTINISENYSLNFGRPSITYEGQDIEGDSTSGTETIYSRFYSGYFADRFSKECALLTCYVNLSISDIHQDLFRKFIFIRDTIWVLNKIIHFNPCSPEPTKVELIKVQDINAYISQNYITGNLIINVPNDGSGNNLGTIYNYVDGPNINPIVLRFDSSARNITFQLIPDNDWIIYNQQGLSVSPISGVGGAQATINVNVSENITGSLITSYFNIRWGNTTTIVQIVQTSNWSVTTSVNPTIGGISNATGGGESGSIISVPNNTSITLSVILNEGYGFNYWLINGEYYFEQTPTFNVMDDVNAVAYVYNESDYIRVTTTDQYTQVIGQPKYGSYYWLLEQGETYTFQNAQDNLSGYAFSDSVLLDPENFTKSFTADDTLVVYYDTLLANVVIENNSSTIFDSANVRIITPSDVPVTIFGGTVSAGNTIARRIIYETTEYGLYTFQSNDTVHDIEFSQNTITYSQGMAIPTIIITVTDHFEPELAIAPTSMSVGANVETYTIDLTCNTTWECVIDDIYDGVVNVVPLFGEGDTTVSVTTGANGSGNTRVGIAEFKTTYGADDKVVNHTVTQRPLDGILTVNFINTIDAAITLATPIVGSIIRTSNNSIVEQFDITSVPAGGVNYEFKDIAEGDYSVSLSTYTGDTSSSTYSILPASAQSIGVIGGQTVGVSYGIAGVISRQLILTRRAVVVESLLNNFTMQVVASDGLSWSLSDNTAWISYSPTTGTGTQTVNVTVGANLLGNRQGRITVTSTNGTPVLSDFCNVSQIGIL